MAGPGTSQELLAEIASRPGRDTVLSFAVKAAFIATSLLFLAALLFALNPLATLVTAYRGVLVDGTFPPWPSVAAAAAMGAAALVLGRSVSVRMHARVIDRL